MIYKIMLAFIFQTLLFLNAASGMWSAQTLYKNKDYKKTCYSAGYALSSFLIFLFVISADAIVRWPIYLLIMMNLLLIFSLMLFTLDSIRGNLQLKRKGNKNANN